MRQRRERRRDSTDDRKRRRRGGRGRKKSGAGEGRRPRRSQRQGARNGQREQSAQREQNARSGLAGRANRSAPAASRRSRSRWRPADRPAASGRGPSEAGAAGGSASHRSRRPRITDKLMVITEHGDRGSDRRARGEHARAALRHPSRCATRWWATSTSGRIQNVLPGMEAAFVDIGRGRNGVLYAGEVNYSPEDLEGGRPPRIEQVLKSGQAVMVQVTKDPMGGKGARLTAQVSLPGRFLVLAPDQDVSGISPPAVGRRAQAPEVDPEQGEAEGARGDRSDGRRGRLRGGDHARPRAPDRALGADPEDGEAGQGARGPVRGAGAHGAGGPRPVHRRGVPRSRHRLRAHLRQGHGLRARRGARPRVEGHAPSTAPCPPSRSTGSSSRSTRRSTGRSGSPRAAT